MAVPLCTVRCAGLSLQVRHARRGCEWTGMRRVSPAGATSRVFAPCVFVSECVCVPLPVFERPLWNPGKFGRADAGKPFLMFDVRCSCSVLGFGVETIPTQDAPKPVRIPRGSRFTRASVHLFRRTWTSGREHRRARPRYGAGCRDRQTDRQANRQQTADSRQNTECRTSVRTSVRPWQ